MGKLANIGAGILLSAALIGLAGGPHFTRRNYIATVTEKVVKRYNNSDKYLVFTKLSNGEIRVFENRDSLLEFKFRSSDLQAKLETGKTYDIKAYGWRIPLTSWYENVISAEEK